jgi:hypothetical protein
MGNCLIAASLAVTYVVVTIAWCFALVNAVVWLRDGIPVLAHAIGEQVEVAISGRPVPVSPSAATSAGEFAACNPTEPTRCGFLPVDNDPPPTVPRSGAADSIAKAHRR